MEIIKEFRLALRTLGKNLSFTTTSVATLALAIGSNAAMFSVLNAVLLRPLPYRSPEQLAMVWTEVSGQNLRQGRSAYLSVQDWQRQNRSFADIAFFDPASVTLATDDKTERISVARASPNFFPLIGVQPLHGRIFSAEEADQRRRVSLISHRFWQTRFAGSSDAIGKSINLDGSPSEIIGILPEGFQGAAFNFDVWEPHTLLPDWETLRARRGAGSWFVIGRLRPDVTFAQAQMEMSAMARRIDEQLPAADRTPGISIIPFSLYVVGPSPRLALWLLTGAVFCVLLIAVANVTSLSLARSVGRAPELAIRAALGASPQRIMRQLLFETITLGTIAGVAGSLLALGAIRLIRIFGPGNLARINEVSLDLRVLAWTSAISLLTGILIGLAPALMMMWRKSQHPGVASGRGVSSGVATRGIRRTLVVAELALAIVLLAGAGLLIRSWWFLERVDPGFSPERVLSMQLSTTAFTSSALRADFYSRVLKQIQSLPGVENAGIIGDLFINSTAEPILTTEGNARIFSERVQLRTDEVSDGLFTTTSTPLLRGRFFSDEDGPNSPPVVIINDALARRLWPGLDPVGMKFKFGPTDSERPWLTVVGVVGNMRRQGLEQEPIPQVFVPLAQDPSRLATLLVRTAADDPLEMAGTIQTAVHRLEKDVPLYGITTLDARLGASLDQRRFQTLLVIAFSIVALVMAAIGIYGLIQYSVATRTKEIAIRLAVGAEASHIFRMIIREGLMLSLVGLVFGLVGARWVGQVSSSFLFEVAATDPLTFISISLLLSLVSLSACYFPARRAMNVEPVVALQQH